ncbi:MAG TPA: hypothetical protein VM238_14110 [Phycisphaerae bacterium]|nr:hypothetical protein [Phycisphaerae bacterium]
MRTKTFDCVAMKRQGAIRVYEQTKDMTLDQQVAFWKARSAALRKRCRAIRRSRARRGR